MERINFKTSNNADKSKRSIAENDPYRQTFGSFLVYKKLLKSGGFEKRKFLKPKFFQNSTGPGDYEVSTQFGSEYTRAPSTLRSSPFYSMRWKCKTPLISKEHY